MFRVLIIGVGDCLRSVVRAFATQDAAEVSTAPIKASDDSGARNAYPTEAALPRSIAASRPEQKPDGYG